MKPENRLLQRQLKRNNIDYDNLPDNVKNLLCSVEESYVHFEQDRQLIERTMDISSQELTDTNRLLNQQKAELELSNSELERFAYISAHDLKEPLRSISGFIQLISKREPNLSNQSREFIQYAIQGTKNMKEMLDDLMIYSTLNIYKKKDATEQDLNEIIQNVRLNLSDKIRKTNANIIHQKLPTIVAEKGLMIQLFQNMIDNSIKFRKKEAPEIHIISKMDMASKNYVFSIIDNGIGIEEKYKDKVFQLFQRLHNKEMYAGTGLGLAICKKIIESQSGRINIDSDYNEGLKIDFTLPAAA